MTDRDIPPLLEDHGELPQLLRVALETSKDDELPNRARMNRIEGHLSAALARDRYERTQAPEARISAWRPRRHIRFAGAKVGLAALVGMGAAWSSVEGYRVYQATIARTTEKSPEVPGIEARVERSKPKTAPPPDRADEARSRAEDERLEPPPMVIDPEPGNAGPFVVAKSEAVSRLSAKPSYAPRSNPGVDLPSPPPKIESAPLPQEEDLLERATQALRRDPLEALTLADEHTRTFGAGRLAQEREFIAIQALSKLSRFDTAGGRAKAFLERYSNSPYANDVRRLAAAAGAR